jgi:hypothetical protein
MSGVGSQISIAVAKPVITGSVDSEQKAVTSAGQVITGAAVSSITIVALQVDVLPQSSDAVHVLISVYA